MDQHPHNCLQTFLERMKRGEILSVLSVYGGSVTWSRVPHPSQCSIPELQLTSGVQEL